MLNSCDNLNFTALAQFVDVVKLRAVALPVLFSKIVGALIVSLMSTVAQGAFVQLHFVMLLEVFNEIFVIVFVTTIIAPLRTFDRIAVEL